MKKLFTLLTLCVLGTAFAWGESGDITALPFSVSYTADNAVAPFDGGTIIDGTNIDGLIPGRGNTITAYFDTDEVADQRTPYTLQTNETITISFKAFHGWWAYSGGGTFSILNSDGTALVSYTYNSNSTNVTDVSIGGSTVSDFNAFTCIAGYNANGNANGFTGSNKPYVTTEGYIPTVTITIDNTGYITFNITCTNPKSGNVDETFSATASNTTIDLAKITLTSTDSRSGGDDRTLGINDLSISSEISETSSYSYTINYICGENIIKTVNAKAEEGAVITAETDVIWDGTTKYTVDDNATTQLTVTNNESNNILNVAYNLVNSSTATLEAYDSSNNLLKSWAETRYEDEDASYIYYTRVIYKDEKYYTTTAKNDNSYNYGISFAYGDATKTTPTYTLDEDIEYYSESESMSKSRSTATQIEGKVPERASGGHWYRIYPNAYVYTSALSGGVYEIELSARNEGSSESTLVIKTYDGTTLTETGNSATWASANNSVQTFSDITVPAGSYIAIHNETSSNSGAALDYVIVRKTGELTEEITVNSTGISSYVTTNALNFSDVDGLTAYIATEETSTNCQLTEVTEVPAGTPIIVRGTASTTFNVPVGTCTELSTTNLLAGSATETHTVTSSETIYALSATYGDLRKVSTGVVIPAKKAYLISTIATSATAKSISFGNEEEDPTAVNSVSAEGGKTASKFFNAAGQQVDANYKGFVIDENGKKYIKK